MTGVGISTGVAPAGLVQTLARIDRIGSRIQEIDPAWDRAWLDAVGGSGRPRNMGNAGFELTVGPPVDAETDPSSAVAAGLGGLATGEFGRAMASLGVQAVSDASPQFASVSAGLLVAPVVGGRTSQPFGPTNHQSEPAATVDGRDYDHFHDGLDLAAPLGRPVTAAAGGQVAFAGRTADGAVVVRIVHGDGNETRYGHLGAGLDVQAGDWVEAGDRIGAVGLTGNTTGPHLHFELWRDGHPVDPAPWIGSGGGPASLGLGGLFGGPSASARGAAVLARFDAAAGQIPYAKEIRAAAIEAGIDPLLLASLVRAESGFRPDAESGMGAMGLTQLMPATAASMHVADPFEPAQNLRAGAKYLGANLRIYGRVDLALAAYQAGKGAVSAAGGIRICPLPATTSTPSYGPGPDTRRRPRELDPGTRPPSSVGCARRPGAARVAHRRQPLEHRYAGVPAAIRLVRRRSPGGACGRRREGPWGIESGHVRRDAADRSTAPRPRRHDGWRGGAGQPLRRIDPQ